MRYGLIRATFGDGPRVGEWARLVDVGVVASGVYSQCCYEVEFLDGTKDVWPIEDSDAGYEFSPRKPEVRT